WTRPAAQRPRGPGRVGIRVGIEGIAAPTAAWLRGRLLLDDRRRRRYLRIVARLLRLPGNRTRSRRGTGRGDVRPGVGGSGTRRLQLPDLFFQLAIAELQFLVLSG